MLSLEPIRKNPVATLCVLVAGILGWVASGLMHNPEPVANRPEPPDLPPPVLPDKKLLIAKRMAEAAALTGTAVVSDEPNAGVLPLPYRTIPSELLPRLKPGMSRVAIENLIGPPTAAALEPAAIVAGRLTYRTAYELADFETPATIRPIRHLPPIPPRAHEPPEAKSLVALEFDASKPGHPLIEIHYLDPLF
jgi:hypothetical protein